MREYFPAISKINYEGKNTFNSLAYQYYNPGRIIFGKKMEDVLNIGVCMWHTFCWQGNDMFGDSSMHRQWLESCDLIKRAMMKIDAAFEFVEKLNIPFISFHDTDVIPEAENFKDFVKNTKIIQGYLQNKIANSNIKVLLGTSNLFSNPRFMAGAATNPNPEVFAFAAAKVANAMNLTHELKGRNYVLWGGREGYDTLLNTSIKREIDQLGKFVQLVVDYKYKIGYKGEILIEPKPCEPTKHQYDYDVATVYGFLQKFGLEKEVKVNLEANHATLAGHTFAHEVELAYANNIFGSIDANRGDSQLGWDTDQFPNNIEELVTVIHSLIVNGGFKLGGFNFDAKLRRQSISSDDLFYAHIGGIDALAKSLLIVETMIRDNFFGKIINDRYGKWESPLGHDIMNGNKSLENLYDYVINNNFNTVIVSGKQELIENMLNKYIWNGE